MNVSYYSNNYSTFDLLYKRVDRLLRNLWITLALKLSNGFSCFIPKLSTAWSIIRQVIILKGIRHEKLPTHFISNRINARI